MMEVLLPLLIQAVSGAVGANAETKAVKNQSLGTVGNSIVGLLGGVGGAQLLDILNVVATNSTGDATSIAGSVVGGGAGGAILLLIVNLVKKALGK